MGTNNSESTVKEKLRKKTLHRLWINAVSVLGGLVVFCITYMLILPAITMSSQQANCGYEEHVHGDECYDTEGNLICGLEEHVHTLECYSDLNADIENEEIWNMETPQLTADRNADVVEIAAGLIGYRESDRNYLVAEGEETKGYTRFGHWYGEMIERKLRERAKKAKQDPPEDMEVKAAFSGELIKGHVERLGNKLPAYAYLDWNAMFVSYVLGYAQVGELGYEYDAGNWAGALSASGQYIDAADYIPAEGDLIFFTPRKGDKVQVGIVSHVNKSMFGFGEGVSSLTVILGDYENAVSEIKVAVNEQSEGDVVFEKINGYAVHTPREAEEVKKDESITASIAEFFSGLFGSGAPSDELTVEEAVQEEAARQEQTESADEAKEENAEEAAAATEKAVTKEKDDIDTDKSAAEKKPGDQKKQADASSERKDDESAAAPADESAAERAADEKNGKSAEDRRDKKADDKSSEDKDDKKSDDKPSGKEDGIAADTSDAEVPSDESTAGIAADMTDDEQEDPEESGVTWEADAKVSLEKADVDKEDNSIVMMWKVDAHLPEMLLPAGSLIRVDTDAGKMHAMTAAQAKEWAGSAVIGGEEVCFAEDEHYEISFQGSNGVVYTWDEVSEMPEDAVAEFVSVRVKVLADVDIEGDGGTVSFGYETTADLALVNAGSNYYITRASVNDCAGTETYAYENEDAAETFEDRILQDANLDETGHAAKETGESAGKGSDKEDKAAENEKMTLTASGNDYKVTMTYGPDAGIPDTAKLSVKEIREGSAEYKGYIADSMDVLNLKKDEGELRGKFYDLKIMTKEGEFEPLSPVNVAIEFTNALETEDAILVNAVRFMEDGASKVAAKAADADGEVKKVEFVAESLSVYGIVYAPAFRWDVDGREYDFSLPGGGYLSLRSMMETIGVADSYEGFTMADGEAETEEDSGESDAADSAPESDAADSDPESDAADSDLGSDAADSDPESDAADSAPGSDAADSAPGSDAADSDPESDAGSGDQNINDIEISRATEKFVDSIEDVTFSNPDLLWVGKSEDDCTLGYLKGINFIDVQYSDKLSDEQIGEMNAQTVKKGDWALIGKQAFMSEEKLTVTMKDGESFVVRITDDQINKIVSKAEDGSWEITVAYGRDAGIPEDAELAVSEITEDNVRFDEYYAQSAELALKEASDKGIEMPNVSGMHIFDIEIHGKEGKIEPKAPVYTNIRLVGSEADSRSVVHFADRGPEAMELQGEADEDGTAGDEPEEMSFGEKMLRALADIVTGGEDLDETVSDEEDKAGDEAVISDLSFETSSFSIYTAININSSPLDLSGNKGYAIVSGIANDRGEQGWDDTFDNVVYNSKYTKFVNGMALHNGTQRADNLNGISTMGVHIYQEGGVWYVGGEVVEWYFEPSYDSGYHLYYKDNNGGKVYLYDEYNGGDPTGNLGLTRDQSIASTFWFQDRGDGTYNIRHYEWYMRNTGNGQWTARAYTMGNSTQNIDHPAYCFRICEIDESKESYSAKKIAVTDLGPSDNSWTKEEIVIYYKFEDQSGNDILYALAHDGSLVRVYDGGEDIYWRDLSKSIYWTVEKPSGSSGYRVYMDDPANPSQKIYLYPSVTEDRAIAPESAISGNVRGLTLSGMDYGTYGTSFKIWDDGAYDYAGLTIAMSDAGILYASTEKESEEEPHTFFIASHRPMPSDTPQTVETVDSAALGIKITMFDYDDGQSHVAGDKLDGMTNIVGSRIYTIHNAQDLVTPYLYVDPSGWSAPVNKAGQPMRGLFDPTYAGQSGNVMVWAREDITDLFLKSYYDETGTFRYRSEDNYAYLDKNGKSFKVYRQVATPKTDNVSLGHTYNYHGHFMPYNDIDTSRKVGRLMDQYGNADFASDLPVEDGRTYDSVYGIQGTGNFYTGMKMEAQFIQPVNGTLENGDDMVFRFTGDDDMWVYIDGVLVLDIGGIHEPLSGTINFSTGIVTNPIGSSLVGTRSLKEIFTNAYNNADDPTKAKLAWVNDPKSWNGNTFADYDSHSFTSFYMERGSGASNLDIQFNLKVKKPNEFEVEKQLPAQYDTRFINYEYQYHVTYKDAQENVHNLDYDQNHVTIDSVCQEAYIKDQVDSHGDPIHIRVTDGIFSLRPGQTAVFVMKDDTTPYDVKEIGIDTGHIEKVVINEEEKWTYEQWEADNSKTDADAGYARVIDRPEVHVVNYPFEQGLKITKNLTADTKLEVGEDPRFEFRLYAETTDTTAPAPNQHRLIAFGEQPYYLMKGEDYYRFDDNSQPEKFVPTTDQPNPPIFSSGRNGSISQIPPGYTVYFPYLVAGTNFYIEEVGIPEGYEYKKDQSHLVAGTCNPGHIPAYSVQKGSDSTVLVPLDTNFSKLYGEVVEKKDAEAEVVNGKEGIQVKVRKIWDKNIIPDSASAVVELHRLAKKTKGSITATLTDQDNAAVQGANFMLYKYDDERSEFVATGTVVTTNESGKATVDNLDPGIYKLVQISEADGCSIPNGAALPSAQDDYALEPGARYVETDEHEIYDNYLVKQDYDDQLYNRRDRVEGIFTLIVKDGEQPVPGIVNGSTFALYRAPLDDPENYQLYHTDYHLTGETNEPGTIIVALPESGRYLFRQISVPSGYIMPEILDTEYFEVQDDPKAEQEKTVTFVNEKKKRTTIEVTVRKQDTQEVIPNATVQLMLRGVVIESANTDQEGKVTFGQSVFLEEDTGYVVRQLSTGDAGFDYKVAPDEQGIVVDAAGGTRTVTLEDARKGRGTITVTVEKEDDQAVLSGEEVHLIQYGTVLAVGTTDANGQVTFADLYEGEYTIHHAPNATHVSGYQYASDRTVTIPETSTQGTNHQVTLVCPKIMGDVTVKLWVNRGPGSENYNWRLLGTYEHLELKPYSFAATLNPEGYRQGAFRYYWDEGDYNASQDGHTIDTNELQTLDVAGTVTGGNTFHVTFTPPEDEKTYNLVVISTWGLEDVIDFVREEGTTPDDDDDDDDDKAIVKLWKKQGSRSSDNWTILGTYELDPAIEYSFTAVVDGNTYSSDVLRYYTDEGEYSGGHALDESALQTLSQAGSVSDEDDAGNRSFNVRFTPQLAGKTYNLVVISDWGDGAIGSFIKDEDPPSGDEDPPSGTDSVQGESGSKSAIRFMMPDKTLSTETPVGSSGDEPDSKNTDSEKTTVESGNIVHVSKAAQMKVFNEKSTPAPTPKLAPVVIPEGYMEDPNFTPIEVTLKESNSYMHTFEPQSRVDANGEPYKYYIVEKSCTPSTFEAILYENNPVDMDTAADTTIKVTNAKAVGSLKIEKTATVNGQIDTEGELNGTYTFTINGKADTETAGNTATVRIELTNGYASAAEKVGTSVPADVAVSIASSTVTVSNLPVGDYSVAEDTTGLRPEINIVGDNPQEISVTGDDPGEIQTAEFTNNMNLVEFRVIKVDETTRGTANERKLANAKFRLFKKDTNDQYNAYPTGESDRVTGQDGTASYTELPNGEYMLQEIDSPVGYVMTEEVKIYFKLDNGSMTWTDENGTAITTGNEPDLISYEQAHPAAGASPATIDTFTVGNPPGVKLPSTGGFGTGMIYLLGFLLAGIGGAGLVLRRKTAA